METKEKNKEDIKNIIENYKNLEKELIAQLNYGVYHKPTSGGFREEIWKSFFERIIPKKFKIERSVFIMDSNKNFSNEVDLAIYDEQYTPYVFNYGKIKFIPIEAVAAVIECKSSGYDGEQVKNWIESIKELKTSNESIVRTLNFISYINSVKTQTSTAPIKIFCHVPNSGTEEVSCKSLLGKGLDIIIEAKKKSKKLNIHFEHETLYEWFEAINHKEGLDLNFDDMKFKENIEKLQNISIKENYKVAPEGNEVPLLSFIFQFNQLLMLLNNPMFFPHQAYVNLFNGKSNEEDE